MRGPIWIWWIRFVPSAANSVRMLCDCGWRTWRRHTKNQSVKYKIPNWTLCAAMRRAETRHRTAAVRFALTDKRRDETFFTLIRFIRLPKVTANRRFFGRRDAQYVRGPSQMEWSWRHTHTHKIEEETKESKRRRFWSECLSLSPWLNVDALDIPTMSNGMHNYELLFLRVEI